MKEEVIRSERVTKKRRVKEKEDERRAKEKIEEKPKTDE